MLLFAFSSTPLDFGWWTVVKHSSVPSVAEKALKALSQIACRKPWLANATHNIVLEEAMYAYPGDCLQGLCLDPLENVLDVFNNEVKVSWYMWNPHDVDPLAS